MLGGLIRIDLLECIPYAANEKNPHVRITAFTNLPIHSTSPEKAAAIFNEPPSIFWSRKSIIEVVTHSALGETLLPALDLDLKSTGNADRNTVEIVFAGLGFVAIGGNFLHAKVKVWSPGGRGVGVRRPIVDKVSGGYRLDIVRRKKVGRLIILGRKAIGAKVEPYFQTDVVGIGASSVKGFKVVRDGGESGEMGGDCAIHGESNKARNKDVESGDIPSNEVPANTSKIESVEETVAG